MPGLLRDGLLSPRPGSSSSTVSDLEPDLPYDALADPDTGSVCFGLGQELDADLFQRFLHPDPDFEPDRLAGLYAHQGALADAGKPAQVRGAEVEGGARCTKEIAEASGKQWQRLPAGASFPPVGESCGEGPRRRNRLVGAVSAAHHLRKAEFATLRLRLLKIAARVTETVSRIPLAFAAACPEASLFHSIAITLQPAGP